MTVSLLEILAAARAHAAPLAAESAGHLLLAVADHVVAAPRATAADEVELHADGSVRLRARRGGSSMDGAEQAVRRLLARALEVSSSVGPALRRTAERRDSAGLEALVRELEAALIPVNRSAARRALSRLHRETERARAQGKLEALLHDESEPVVLAADFPEAATPAPRLPALEVFTPPPPRAPAPPPMLDLSPPPPPEDPVALTKPEPVVQRARERASSTPRLGTVITAQTLPGEEAERTERAPDVTPADDEEAELDMHIEVELPSNDAPEAADVAQPVTDPSPSRMPDVVMAMVALHTGLDADETPTRLRDVITELRPPALTPEPRLVEDSWLTRSSLEGIVTASKPLLVELVDPSVHEALTWNPGGVAPAAEAVAEPEAKAQAEPEPELRPQPEPEPQSEIDLAVLIMRDAEPSIPASLLIPEPAPEPPPYAPAVLPACTSDVSELLDSFHVSGAAEERELRGALKEIAGLDLTPMPHPFAEAD
ncbi:MAG TPA: hypothetical protein VJN18_16770 [Polyangiaceae bacterium]|nr:hypothetical protein [Polyangiaceae bacterium]